VVRLCSAFPLQAWLVMYPRNIEFIVLKKLDLPAPTCPTSNTLAWSTFNSFSGLYCSMFLLSSCRSWKLNNIYTVNDIPGNKGSRCYNTILISQQYFLVINSYSKFVVGKGSVWIKIRYSREGKCTFPFCKMSRHLKYPCHLGTDHLTWRGGGVMVFCFV
jgi:hypothetical protein